MADIIRFDIGIGIFFKEHLDKYSGTTEEEGTFGMGFNQLWRNQMFAFALQRTGAYSRVTFSVCHHARNTMLNRTIVRYKALVGEDKMFSSFTNYNILEAISTKASELQPWMKRYKEVYYL